VATAAHRHFRYVMISTYFFFLNNNVAGMLFGCWLQGWHGLIAWMKGYVLCWRSRRGNRWHEGSERGIGAEDDDENAMMISYSG
jgi:hypothetical protein